MSEAPVLDQTVVIEAIAASWSRETSEVPERWRDSNRPQGHCDVSSFVAWEHLGGDLVLGQVHLDGQFQEYHYWNRIDGVDLDLTRDQFRAGEVISEHAVIESAFLASNQAAMKPEVLARIVAFRDVVNKRLSQRGHL